MLCGTLGDFLRIPTQNTGQLNPLFHASAEFRLIVNRIVAWQFTDWLAANAQFSPNDPAKIWMTTSQHEQTTNRFAINCRVVHHLFHIFDK